VFAVYKTLVYSCRTGQAGLLNILFTELNVWNSGSVVKILGFKKLWVQMQPKQYFNLFFLPILTPQTITVVFPNVLL